MSVSKWAYDPGKCDGEYCAGECDLCGKAKANDKEDKPGGFYRDAAGPGEQVPEGL